MKEMKGNLWLSQAGTAKAQVSHCSLILSWRSALDFSSAAGYLTLVSVEMVSLYCHSNTAAIPPVSVPPHGAETRVETSQSLLPISLQLKGHVYTAKGLRSERTVGRERDREINFNRLWCCKVLNWMWILWLQLIAWSYDANIGSICNGFCQGRDYECMQSRFIVKYAYKHCLMNKQKERETEMDVLLSMLVILILLLKHHNSSYETKCLPLKV